MGNITYRDFRLLRDKEANRYTVSLPFTKAVDYVMELDTWEYSDIGGAVLDLVEELAGDTGSDNPLHRLYRDKALDTLGCVDLPVETEHILALAAHWYNAGFEAGKGAGGVP